VREGLLPKVVIIDYALLNLNSNGNYLNFGLDFPTLLPSNVQIQTTSSIVEIVKILEESPINENLTPLVSLIPMDSSTFKLSVFL